MLNHMIAHILPDMHNVACIYNELKLPFGSRLRPDAQLTRVCKKRIVSVGNYRTRLFKTNRTGSLVDFPCVKLGAVLGNSLSPR